MEIDMNVNDIRNKLSSIYAKIDEDLKNGEDRGQLLDDLADMIVLINKLKIENGRK